MINLFYQVVEGKLVPGQLESILTELEACKGPALVLWLQASPNSFLTFFYDTELPLNFQHPKSIFVFNRFLFFLQFFVVVLILKVRIRGISLIFILIFSGRNIKYVLLYIHK
jgi:hypothetical protein